MQLTKATEAWQVCDIAFLAIQLSCLMMAHPAKLLAGKVSSHAESLKDGELRSHFSTFDLRRLESYSRSMVDYHIILDMVPQLARLWFQSKLPVSLSPVQAAVLLAMGLQCKSVDEVENDLALPGQQLLALFNKAMRKMSTFLSSVEHAAVGAFATPVDGGRTMS